MPEPLYCSRCGEQFLGKEKTDLVGADDAGHPLFKHQVCPTKTEFDGHRSVKWDGLSWARKMQCDRISCLAWQNVTDRDVLVFPFGYGRLGFRCIACGYLARPDHRLFPVAMQFDAGYNVAQYSE